MSRSSRKDIEKETFKKANQKIILMLGNHKQREIADLIGWDEQSVSKALSGSRDFKIDEYIKIADFFGVTLDFLFDHNVDPDAMTCRSIKDVCTFLYAIYESPYRFSIDTSMWDSEGIVKFFFPFGETEEDHDRPKYGTDEYKRYDAAIEINDFLDRMYMYTREYREERIEIDDHKERIKKALSIVSDAILEDASGFYASDKAAEPYIKQLKKSKMV